MSSSRPTSSPAPTSSVPERTLSSARQLTRARDWWSHKVPIVLLFAYVALLGNGSEPGVDPGEAMLSLAAFLVAIVGVAGFGHVVNDLADARQDGRAGRARAAAALDRRNQRIAVGVLLAVGLLPWLYLPTDARTRALLVAEVVLLTVYSVPPTRLKERGLVALPVDAAYAYAVPCLLTLATFTLLPGAATDLGVVAVAGGTWGLVVGLRSILFHQIDDRALDRAGGVATWAAQTTPARATRLTEFLVVIEVVLFAVLVVVLYRRMPLLPVLVAITLGWRFVELHLFVGYEPADADDGAGRVRRTAFSYLNDHYERWLPVLVVATLAARDGAFLWLLLAHALLFRNGLVDLVHRDLPKLPSVRYTLAYRFTYWGGRWNAWRARRHPEPEAPPVPAGVGRYVYVVCGPASHVRTLHRSLAALAPRTAQEVVVVTDTRRNEIPIEFDHVIDVATPSGLTHHEASIWLKTGVHRHVPLDRTCCYLDTDVIAISARVDDVFATRSGPVTFTPDLPVFDNCIDRFSPWAMTCACTGLGDLDSCTHLREALLERFGLAIPSDWVPWNGGVFLFDRESTGLLDRWHEITVSLFADDRFQTRDQHALIATVWEAGLEDGARLPPAFNLIVDLGNCDVTWYGGGRYAIHPDAEPVDARFLHLYSNALEDPTFDLDRDVNEIVLRQMAQRAADSVREVRVVLSHRSVSLLMKVTTASVGFGRRLASRAQYEWLRAYTPANNTTRRAGRSVARRARVLVGREYTSGGRWDALRFPRGWRVRPVSSPIDRG